MEIKHGVILVVSNNVFSNTLKTFFEEKIDAYGIYRLLSDGFHYQIKCLFTNNHPFFFPEKGTLLDLQNNKYVSKIIMYPVPPGNENKLERTIYFENRSISNEEKLTLIASNKNIHNEQKNNLSYVLELCNNPLSFLQRDDEEIIDDFTLSLMKSFVIKNMKFNDFVQKDRHTLRELIGELGSGKVVKFSSLSNILNKLIDNENIENKEERIIFSLQGKSQRFFDVEDFSRSSVKELKELLLKIDGILDIYYCSSIIELEKSITKEIEKREN